MSENKKIFPIGMRAFAPRPNVPEWVVGNLVISIDEFIAFLNSDEVKPYYSQYQGINQLGFNITKTREGGLMVTVNTFKKEAMDKAGYKKEDLELPADGDDLPF